MLPEQFLARMKKMLGEEYADFLASYSKPCYQSLRVNLLKGKAEDFALKADFLEGPVPWADGGYYYKKEARPGKHPFHEAGVYYIQEASAMAPAAYLNAQPGERILDLCAAPGGKSTQIASAMKGKGLLVLNEVHPQRAKVLSGNIERMGIGNALVLSHDPVFLQERFPAFFDRILVDAPCSGEGMFRKNEEAVNEWSLDHVKMCAQRQRDILESAAAMLRPGGTMVYSTCTFAPEEDEGTVSFFLNNHPEFSLEETEKFPGMSGGMCLLNEIDFDGREKVIRLWPHKLMGEGHFLACLKKEGTISRDTANFYRTEKGISVKDCKEWEDFCNRYLKRTFTGRGLKFGEQLYLIPEEMPQLSGLKVLRPGLHLGTLKKNRFEPAHGLALFLRPEEVTYRLDLSISDALPYLAGQAFPAQGEAGWYLITVEGYSLGWGKLSGGMMKNHYPKGLRWQGFLER